MVSRSVFLQIFLTVAVVSVFTNASAVSLAGCPVEYESLDGLTDDSRAIVKSFAQNAARFVRDSSKKVAERQNEALLKAGRPEIPFGVIEPIEGELLPKDARIAGMARRVNVLFQDHESIEKFVSYMAEQAATRVARSGNLGTADSLLPSLKGKPQLLQNIASEQGWGPIGSTSETLRPDEFRRQVLSRGQLWFDFEGAEISHTCSAHALQWIYVTPILEKEFGPGAAKDLLRYFATAEGFPLWESLFDRGPLYFRDFRGPKAFSAYRLAGPHSWFGVP